MCISLFFVAVTRMALKMSQNYLFFSSILISDNSGYSLYFLVSIINGIILVDSWNSAGDLASCFPRF